MTEIYAEALKAVLSETGFHDVTVESTQADNADYEVISTVGLTGDVKGYFILRSDRKSLARFSATMARQMGIPGEEESEGITSFQKEAIGEFTNQSSGRAIMLLAEKGYDCNITPPTIISGNNVYTDVVQLEHIYTYQIRGDFGILSVFIAVKKQKN